MTPSLCTVLAQYNGWMNVRLYDAAARLTGAQLFEDRGAFFGSIFGTLNHITAADLIWMNRFCQIQELPKLAQSMDGFVSPDSLRQEIAQSLPELTHIRTRLDKAIIELANHVTDFQLCQTVHYSNTAGQRQAKNFGLLLLHFFNHQTHHRGQATTLLFQAGVDVGVTDLNALIASEA